MASIDYAVLGLGPGGLVAAIKALTDGKSVLAIEPRKKYVRHNPVDLDDRTIGILTEIGLDRDGVNSLKGRSLKELENLLFKRLEILGNETGRLTLKRNNGFPNVSEVGVSEVDGTAKSFMVSIDGEQFEPKNIVVAFGGVSKEKEEESLSDAQRSKKAILSTLV